MAAPNDYHRGEMEISEQVSTFHGFIAMSKWGSLVIAVALIFLVVVFCTPGSLLQAAIAAFVVAVGGVLLLREKPGSGH